MLWGDLMAVWGGLGWFGGGLGCFGVVWGVSMDRDNLLLFQPVDSFRRTDKPLFWVHKQLNL